MPDEKLKPHEERELEERREEHRTQQPYASELDDRKLEHAQKERRPLDSGAKSPTAR